MAQIKYNTSPRKGKIKYIVVHDTGNKSRGADADAHFNYFNGGNRGSSADFFVDDKKALQVNDYMKYYTWHCGDGGGKYGITNANSVGVEICVNCDGDYNKAYMNAVTLVKQLMKELNIPIDRVVRHYDASRKCCPASMCGDNWALWEKFKKNIKEENTVKLTSANDIIWELSQKIEIKDVPGAVAALDKAKGEENPLYWILYKLVNKGR